MKLRVPGILALFHIRRLHGYLGKLYWNRRAMAKDQDVSKSTVSNIWRSRNLTPAPGEELQAVAGFALFGEADRCRGCISESAESTRAVLCVDEKTQIQALDRTRAGIADQKGTLSGR